MRNLHEDYINNHIYYLSFSIPAYNAWYIDDVIVFTYIVF